MKSNFEFLKNCCVTLAEMGTAAESELYYNNNACVAKVGTFAELLTEQIFISENMPECIDMEQSDRISRLRSLRNLPAKICDNLNSIRLKYKESESGEKSIYSGEAENILYKAYELAVWFKKTYSDEKFTEPQFICPENKSLALYNAEVSKFKKLPRPNVTGGEAAAPSIKNLLLVLCAVFMSIAVLSTVYPLIF